MCLKWWRIGFSSFCIDFPLNIKFLGLKVGCKIINKQSSRVDFVPPSSSHVRVQVVFTFSCKTRKIELKSCVGNPTQVHVWAWAFNLKKEGTKAPPFSVHVRVQFFLPSVVVFLIKSILKFD